MLAILIAMLLGRLESDALPHPRVCACGHVEWLHGNSDIMPDVELGEGRQVDGCRWDGCGCTEKRRDYGIA